MDAGRDLLRETFTSDSMTESEALAGNFLFVRLTLVNTDGLGAGVPTAVGGFPIKLDGVDGGMVFGSVDDGAEAWLLGWVPVSLPFSSATEKSCLIWRGLTVVAVDG